MEPLIGWHRDLSVALGLAEREEKPILVDFADLPSCIGCTSMETTTYTEKEVANFVSQNFVPVQFNQRESMSVFKKNGVIWTPTFQVLDVKGELRDRWVGYLPPPAFLPRLRFALAQVAMVREDFETATRFFNEITLHYPVSFVAADSLYWLGVARWKVSRKLDDLRPYWIRLQQKYPESEAAAKASCWSELHHDSEKSVVVKTS